MKYNIGKEFSPDPAGRYYSDGNASGEQFREEVLVDKIRGSLNNSETLVLVLDDGVESYGSSFLSEAFGGLVKYGYFDAQTLLRVLSFEYSDSEFDFFENRIIEYIKAAKYDSATYKTTREK